MKEKILNRIKVRREDLKRKKKDDNFGKCLWLEGYIAALEIVLMDCHVASQSIHAQDAKCPECFHYKINFPEYKFCPKCGRKLRL